MIAERSFASRLDSVGSQGGPMICHDICHDIERDQFFIYLGWVPRFIYLAS